MPPTRRRASWCHRAPCCEDGGRGQGGHTWPPRRLRRPPWQQPSPREGGSSPPDLARQVPASRRRPRGRRWKALADAPEASAPRPYVETLNEMIDMQTVRVAALNNRVPAKLLRVAAAAAAALDGLDDRLLAATAQEASKTRPIVACTLDYPHACSAGAYWSAKRSAWAYPFSLVGT